MKLIKKIVDSIKARRIFRKSDKILKSSGGDHCSFYGIDVPYFDGFENIDIKRIHESGTIPRDRIVIKTDDTLVYFAERSGVSFELIKYVPGEWEKALKDEAFI